MIRHLTFLVLIATAGHLEAQEVDSGTPLTPPDSAPWASRISIDSPTKLREADIQMAAKAYRGCKPNKKILHELARTYVATSIDTAAMIICGKLKIITRDSPAWSETRGASSQANYADAPSVIRDHCAKEWPDDFAMRAYCEKQQYQGYRETR